VTLASVVCSVVLGLLLPLAPSFSTLLVLRALQGIAIAGFPGVAAAYLVEQLGKKGVAAAVGAMIAGNTVSGMLGRASQRVLGRPARLARRAGRRRRGRAGVRGGDRGDAAARDAVASRRGPRARRPRRYRRGRPQARPADAVRGRAAGDGLVRGAVRRGRVPADGHPIDLSPALASLVFLAYAMGAASSSMAGRLIARFGRTRSLVAALCTTVLGAALTLPDSLPLIIVGFVVLTGGFFAAHAVANGWAAAEASETARGQVSGLYTLSYYLGSSVGGKSKAPLGPPLWRWTPQGWP
jgi:MFS transporter, YNFM family, putative membrane transport protein